jgi:LDH2 family malate/lactate/ureidoglycolate dehydrogenase
MPTTPPDTPARIAAPELETFIATALRAAGVRDDQAAAVAEALTETSLRGVDSHGARLLLHYATVARTGRINPNPVPALDRTGPATAILDADDGFGHWAGFRAIDAAIDIAKASGAAAVAVVNSSHFGAAGCYPLRAADAGYVAFAFANADSGVLAHDGTQSFHGTNPIGFAAPVAGTRPYLLDMATSSINWNKVHNLGLQGLMLPEDAAVGANGHPTTEPSSTAALLPLGGRQYGYKGAGLASMLEILSAVLTGMTHCGALLQMVGPDLATPRRMGQFYLVIDPDRFVSRAVFDSGMASYLAALRGSPAAAGTRVMAPGDREWEVERTRLAEGIPFPSPLRASFDPLADELKIAPPPWTALGTDP